MVPRVLAIMALLGGLRGLLGDGPQFVVFVFVSLAVESALWWFTAWFMLHGPGAMAGPPPHGRDHGRRDGGYAVSATVWMPSVVTRNQTQFGFFGVALALVTWFSGAAICVLLGACAGAVFAEDTGRVGASSAAATRRCSSTAPHYHFPPPKAHPAARRVPTHRRRSDRALGPSDLVPCPANLASISLVRSRTWVRLPLWGSGQRSVLRG